MEIKRISLHDLRETNDSEGLKRSEKSHGSVSTSAI